MTTCTQTTQTEWVTEVFEDAVSYGFRHKGVLHESQSDFQKITIVATDFYGRMLLLDDKVMTNERDEFVYHEMITHIPMLSHPNPQQVLVIGGGDGGTVREVLKHPSVQRIVLCEIDGAVVDVCRTFLPTIACDIDHPKVQHEIRDGIEYIKTCAGQFDVILVDSTDPVGPGVGLFTAAFYTDVKAALRPGGMMVNQSESPFAMPEDNQNVYRLLSKVFPNVTPYMATVPTYPGGYWSWAFCTDTHGPNPLGTYNETLASTLETSTRYYNQGIHRAAFALPNFAKRQLETAIAEGRSA